MLYQQLLIGDRPYLVACGNMPGFREHKHPEIELSYCLKGEFSVCINKINYTLKEGSLAIVSSMTPHEFPQNSNTDCLGLTIIFGPTFLAQHFEGFSKSVLTNPVISLKDNRHKNLRELLIETAGLCDEKTKFSELLIRGNLYKISAHILSEFTTENSQKKI